MVQKDETGRSKSQLKWMFGESERSSNAKVDGTKGSNWMVRYQKTILLENSRWWHGTCTGTFITNK